MITVSATLQGFDPNQARAGASLGASPVVVFRRIILPLILPGVISGALFAFVTSFDEVVVALFVTGPAERTLPRQMFNGIRENISPVIAAAATFVILISVLLLTALELPRVATSACAGSGPELGAPAAVPELPTGDAYGAAYLVQPARSDDRYRRPRPGTLDRPASLGRLRHHGPHRLARHSCNMSPSIARTKRPWRAVRLPGPATGLRSAAARGEDGR